MNSESAISLFVELIGKDNLQYILDNNLISLHDYTKRKLDNTIEMQFCRYDGHNDMISFLDIEYNFNTQKWMLINCHDYEEIEYSSFKEVAQRLEETKDILFREDGIIAKLPPF